MSSILTRQMDPSENPVFGTTAPVHEFNCLFSHDMRRKKQKRWQDGFLRYHGFNKRVMVYDVSRNFIGDTHLRDLTALNDGDQMQLDAGVLVEVGEAIGVIQQDVTALLAKRKPLDIISGPINTNTPAYQSSVAAKGLGATQSQAFCLSQNGPLANGTSSMSGQPQARPRSLVAVLGTPQGVRGRAVIPKQSPHQQLQELSGQMQEHQRPSKRPRLSLEQDSTRGLQGDLERQRSQRKPQVSSLVTEASKARGSGNTRNQSKVFSKTIDEPVVHVAARPPAPERSRTRNKPQKQPIDRPLGANVGTPPDRVITVEDDKNDEPVNKLRFNTTKRKKLIYSNIAHPRLEAARKRNATSYSPQVQDDSLETGPEEAVPANGLPRESRVSLSNKKFAGVGDDAGHRHPSGRTASKVIILPQEQRVNGSHACNHSPSSVRMPESRESGPQNPCDSSSKASIPNESSANGDLPVQRRSESSMACLRKHEISSSPTTITSAHKANQATPAEEPHQPNNPPTPTKPPDRAAQQNIHCKTPPPKAQKNPALALALARPDPPTITLPPETSSRRQSPLKKSLTEPSSLLKASSNNAAAALPISAPRSSSKLSRSKSAGESPLAATATEHGKPDTGPWSRCAFDLFGFTTVEGAAANEDDLKRKVKGIGGSTRGQLGGRHGYYDEYDYEY